MSIWKTTVSRKSTATVQQIWTVWMDVSNWSRWDADIVKSVLSGAFETGAKGIIKPKSGPKTKFCMIECTAGRSFTNRTVSPLCRVDFIHEVTPVSDGTIVTHTIEITGLLSPLFVRIIGKPQEKNLPLAVDSLIKIAKETK
ncbi:MAG: SRPBCC family protein [Tannerellaceae bacterium]|nr:SRPBCC family protein [Tannerellaceae bacterium]